jgi:hypothetical protein
MPFEDMGRIERFLSPIISTVFFVFVGAEIAPKKQITVACVLFWLNAIARIVLLSVAAVCGIAAVDLSAGGVFKQILYSAAGVLGILFVKWRVTQKIKQEMEDSL